MSKQRKQLLLPAVNNLTRVAYPRAFEITWLTMTSTKRSSLGKSILELPTMGRTVDCCCFLHCKYRERRRRLFVVRLYSCEEPGRQKCISPFPNRINFNCYTVWLASALPPAPGLFRYNASISSPNETRKPVPYQRRALTRWSKENLSKHQDILSLVSTFYILITCLNK